MLGALVEVLANLAGAAFLIWLGFRPRRRSRLEGSSQLLNDDQFIELPPSTPSIELYPRGERPRPAGEWRQVQPQFEVAGIVHNRAAAIKFVTHAAHCDEVGLPYGLHLSREPLNPYDKKAIVVFGWWSDQKTYGPPEPQAVKIGYVPKDIARGIPATKPIAAEVESLYLADRSDGGQFVNVQAYLLEPAKKSSYWKRRGKKKQ